MRELGAELQFQVDVGVVVEVILEMPEVAIGRRGRTRTEQHEVRAVRQRVEDRVADEVRAFWPSRRPIYATIGLYSGDAEAPGWLPSGR